MQMIELENRNGCKAALSTLGASVRSLHVPTKRGNLIDVVLGLSSEDAYKNDELYIGVTIGRYSGRIAGGQFKLPGGVVRLDQNQPPNHLHGGVTGLHQRHWVISELAGDSAEFSCRSPDGEGGYPGSLDVCVRYTLRADNALQIDYRAVSDADTVINLTNHSYFNLAGHDRGSALSHCLEIRSSQIAEIDKESIPTGRTVPVEGTLFDFRSPAVVGQRIDREDPQLELAGGFDHAWVLEGGEEQLHEPVAILFAAESGVSMRVSTDQTSIQFYSANFVPDAWVGKSGATYGAHQGLCLETQHLPNSPNEPAFPSTLLRAGDVFRSQTVYAFDVGYPSEWADA
ncbi:MAG: aldose epimerase family protein [Pseudomonadota bacterium]